MGLQALSPRRSRRVRPRQGEFHTAKLSLVMLAGGFPLAPCTPSGHRKKSVRAPWDGQSHFAPESARQAPPEAVVCACRRTGGFPRGKQSARPALPCAPLVVCLNFGSLTAFGGCAHWARASLRSPSPLRAVVGENPTGYKYSGRKAGWLSARPPAPPSGSRRVNPRRGQEACACEHTKGLSSGQTIGAVRTAVCLPERPGASRSNRTPRGACPLQFLRHIQRQRDHVRQRGLALLRRHGAAVVADDVADGQDAQRFLVQIGGVHV